MDRTGPSRQRRRDATHPAKPPIRVPRGRKGDKNTSGASARDDATTSPVAPGRVRAESSGSEAARAGRRRDGGDSQRTMAEEEIAAATRMTVTNVGKGGKLYLRPSRMALPKLSSLPATPPATSEGESLTTRNSDSAAGPHFSRSATTDGGMLHPSMSSQKHKRTRSHSFSSTNDRRRVPTFESNDFYLMLGDVEAQKRPKSFADMQTGLLDLQIPDYRLGSPRFSERGGAYLRSSTHRGSSEAPQSSVFSHDEREVNRMFPMSSARRVSRINSHQSISANHRHAHARVSSRIPVDFSTFSIIEPISPLMFDRLEANPHDPAVVHYHPLTGRIVAATPARLISQITSPQFLDYELLSDFFLTFRCFVSCQDVLEYLLARMKWAFNNASDSGRIVRVRTFVALRHWILNYFPDDFLLDIAFRERFCELINGMSDALRTRPDHGGSDMKILGELKKCWQRTCALYWPAPNATVNMHPEDDITPGGERQATPFGPSVLSLPLTIRPATRGGSSIFEVAQMPMPDPPQLAETPRRHGNNTSNHFEGPRTPTLARIPSIPASPMSDRSLEVLSCSVPFLQHLRTRDRPDGLTKRPDQPLRKKATSQMAQRHERSASFSDALRDARFHNTAQNIEGIDLPNFAVSGGLVRGILLQPCPSKLDLAVPISPTEADSRGSQTPESSIAERPTERPAERSQHNSSVKKIVGLTRRALSVRKAPSEMVARSHRPTQSSSDILQSGRSTPSAERKLPIKQHLPGPPRLDVLAERVEAAYHRSFEPNDNVETESRSVEAPRPLFTPSKDAQTEDLHSAEEPLDLRNMRQGSHLTTSSRSILIVDATGAPELPEVSEGLSDISNMSSVLSSGPFINNIAYPDSFPQREQNPRNDLPLRQYDAAEVEDDSHWRSSEANIGDFLSVPDSIDNQHNSLHADSRLVSEDFTPRKSSIIHPAHLNLPIVQQQLRRRPGGDLKATDNVHNLVPQRPFSEATFSTNPGSAGTSGLFPREALREPSSAHLDQSLSPANGLPPAPDPPKASVGLSDIQSTQHHVRPSFESDAMRLKGLPDADSEGGIEDALLKLEGKIPSPSHSTFSNKGKSDAPASPTLKVSKLAQVETADSVDHLDHPRALQDRGLSPTMTETQGASIYHISDSIGRSNVSRVDLLMSNQLPADKHDPKNSPDFSAHMESRISNFPVHEPFPLGSSQPASIKRSENELSSVKGKEGEITLNFDAGAIPEAAQQVLGTDDGDLQSDISTEIADQPEGDPGARSLYFGDTTEDRVRQYQQSRSHANVNLHPPWTPPPSAGPSAKTSEDKPSERAERNVLHKKLPKHLQERPLKGVASAPKLRSPPPDRPLPRPPTIPLRRIQTLPIDQPPAHMPFVLAFESYIIAEQLTIIEKDALDEVDWKDLISLNWQQRPPLIRNWVDYLKMEASNGIDVVIARHNLAIKWIVSEILLTNAPSERARAITKYVHVASHCHRLRNFASMYQIILALLCPDLMRLHKTWTLVAFREKQILSELEALCQPVRNFNNLRTEMENVDPSAGCIPFIGLYTHDLMFNAQKPSRLEPVASGKEPLINFERYQTAATIVKGLLRMIEASSKYTFRPHPEALSRCLWIAALDDREIVARSKALETT